ncbi:uncharacterized protein LOC114522194 [Dendronephthya gigantea]|uniref:uncharacterized protein LOC114522194 n=1 Tax=Dendronephthya gigantea TaxID=151771 RepID=UPI00106B47E6|nr:uncharacterized protein LOC114522194 [Dendronephthya gigantea]
MGGESSKTVIKYVPVESQIDIKRQLDESLAEVHKQKCLVTENIVEQIQLQQNAVIMKYSDLTDKGEIVKDIRGIVKGDHAVEFLADHAEKMIDVFQNSKAMKELQRWNQVKKIKRCGNKVVGMELHYKVIITDEKVGALSRFVGGTNETVVILAYKYIEHALSTDPSTLPDEEKLKALSF